MLAGPSLQDDIRLRAKCLYSKWWTFDFLLPFHKMNKYPRHLRKICNTAFMKQINGEGPGENKTKRRKRK
jgi:hypothetical protein